MLCTGYTSLVNDAWVDLADTDTNLSDQDLRTRLGVLRLLVEDEETKAMDRDLETLLSVYNLNLSSVLRGTFDQVLLASRQLARVCEYRGYQHPEHPEALADRICFTPCDKSRINPGMRGAHLTGVSRKGALNE